MEFDNLKLLCINILTKEVFVISDEVSFYNEKTTNMYKIFITDKNSVFINRIDAYGFSYDFIMNNGLKIFNNCYLKDIVNMKMHINIKELYIEINECGINKFVQLENENKVKSESDLDITVFSKQLITKSYTKEKTLKINELLEYLKINNAAHALQLIQYIKLKSILNDFDVCKLYILYSNYLKKTSPGFIENNIFYLERLVLGLISLNKINLIL